MPSIPALLRLMPQALLLDGDAYWKMKARPRAFRDGALLLTLLGAGLGLAGAAGAIVTRGATPDPAALARALERGLQGLPALQRLGPEVLGRIGRLLVWLVVPLPQPTLLRLVTAPAGLWAGWLAFGLPAQWAARRLGGRAPLAHTLACTALAEAPRALLLVPCLPPLGLALLGVDAWVLAARFQALRTAHALEGWRAFWATLAAALLPAALSLALAAAGLWLWGAG